MEAEIHRRNRKGVMNSRGSRRTEQHQGGESSLRGDVLREDVNGSRCRERRATVGAANNNREDILFILTDSRAALQTSLNISQSAPPRSGIEVQLKEALRKQGHLDTAIAWIRGHIGTPGNEKADELAAFTSV